MATYIEQSLVMLKQFEGCVPWMYRDTVGKVTVGVGLMLPDAAAAETLPFLQDGHSATPAQIHADFQRVMLLPEGKPAAFYRSTISPELPPPAIDARLRIVLQTFEQHLRARLPHYDSFPDGAKLALLDMIYNLGPGELFSGYPHLLAAVEQGQWAQAAAQCLRHGPGEARNVWTRNQFLSAVLPVIRAEAEGWLKRLWRRLRTLWSPG